MTEAEILNVLEQIAAKLNEAHPSHQYAIGPGPVAEREEPIQQVLYSAIKGVGGQDCASCVLSVRSRESGATETFNVEVFQDQFGTDVRLASFLPELRPIQHVKDLVVFDHVSSPTRMVLVTEESELDLPPGESHIAVAGAECYGELSFASVSRALFNLSVAILALSTAKV